jgi:hypothetical protein
MNDETTERQDREIAKDIAIHHPSEEEATLAHLEFQRKLTKEQHQLDIRLMTKQVRAMRFAAILGVITAIVGAIVGAYLQHMWSQQPPRCAQPTVQQEGVHGRYQILITPQINNWYS